MSDLFIINGLVIDPARKVRERIHLRIRQGKVAEWTKSRTIPNDVTVIDAKGCVVTPGLIDIHTHLREPGEEYKEDIASGAAAAAAGGFTSIVCMANTKPANDTVAMTRFILERAAAVGTVRIYPVGAVSRGLEGEGLADIGDMADAGVVALSDDGYTVRNAQLMRRAMEYASDFGLPIVVHCEEPDLCRGTAMHEGEVSTRIGMRGSPSAAEVIIMQRDIALSELTGVPLHIQHISSAGGVNVLRDAKARRLRVTGEVTPHHLFLTDEDVATFDSHFKMNPPLRTAADRTALRRGLRDGTIEAIATDHAPHSVLEKGDLPFEQAASGVIGMESALPVCLTLVEERIISLPRLVELMTCGPAKILNLPGGRLAVGDMADVTIFDPEQRVTIHAERFLSKSRNCPFDGWKCRGEVRYTIVGGRIVFPSP